MCNQCEQLKKQLRRSQQRVRELKMIVEYFLWFKPNNRCVKARRKRMVTTGGIGLSRPASVK